MIPKVEFSSIAVFRFQCWFPNTVTGREVGHNKRSDLQHAPSKTFGGVFFMVKTMDCAIHHPISAIRRIFNRHLLLVCRKAVPLRSSWSESCSETLPTYWLLVLVLLIMWLVWGASRERRSSFFILELSIRKRDFWFGSIKKNIYICAPKITMLGSYNG